MGKLSLHLVDPEEQLILEFDARDLRAFERVGYRAMGLKGPLQEAISAIPVTYVTWLGWHVAKRTGLTDLGFDDFETRVTDFDQEDDGDDGVGGALGDPTGPAT